MEPWGVCIPEVADSKHFNEKQDPFSDWHKNEMSDPGSHRIDKMDPDQHQYDADPQPCFLADKIMMAIPLQFHIFLHAIGKGRVRLNNLQINIVCLDLRSVGM